MNELTKTEEKKGILYRVSNDFPEPGVRFIDLTPSLVNANYRAAILSAMIYHINYEIGDVDMIISPDARGFLWGMGVATLMNCSFVPVRKSGKLPMNCVFTMVKYDTEYSQTSLDLPMANYVGLKCVFVDDVYATGGTYNACKKLVELAGGKLEHCVVVYDVGLNDNKEVWSITRGDL